MSALELYDSQRDYQLEEGNFSEDFIIDPLGSATVIKGVYDESYIIEHTDQGNFRQQKRKPVILLSTEPDSIVAKTTKITVRGIVRTIQKIDRDPNGIPRLWLL